MVKLTSADIGTLSCLIRSKGKKQRQSFSDQLIAVEAQRIGAAVMDRRRYKTESEDIIKTLEHLRRWLSNCERISDARRKRRQAVRI